MIWDKAYAEDGHESLKRVAILPGGGYVLVGSKHYSDGYSDLWVAGTDSEGEMLWEKTYGGNVDDHGVDVVVFGDGSLALAGETKSEDETLSTGAWWLIRTDSQGNFLWDKTYSSGGAFAGVQDLAVTDDDGFVLAGCKRYNYSDGTDFRLVRTDGEGNLLWDKKYGGGDYECARSVAVLPDGGFAMAGYTESKGAGQKDFWLVRTDADGSLLWDATYGGGMSDRAWAVSALPVPEILSGRVPEKMSGLKMTRRWSHEGRGDQRADRKAGDGVPSGWPEWWPGAALHVGLADGASRV